MMDLLRRLFGIRPSPALQPLKAVRMVVVDVETTGLDPRRDKLLSIGYVPAYMSGIEVGKMHEIIVEHHAEEIDKDNIVVHGITPTESASGQDVKKALQEFVEDIGDSWLIAFHADFDKEVLDRALKKHLDQRLENPVIDLAWIMHLVFPGNKQLRTLDDWLGHFNIQAPFRHRAVADALVTGQLLLIALNAAVKQGYDEINKLANEARAQGQLAQMGYDSMV